MNVKSFKAIKNYGFENITFLMYLQSGEEKQTFEVMMRNKGVNVYGINYLLSQSICMEVMNIIII